MLRLDEWNKKHEIKWQWILGWVLTILILLAPSVFADVSYEFPFKDTLGDQKIYECFINNGEKHE